MCLLCFRLKFYSTHGQSTSTIQFDFDSINEFSVLANATLSSIFFRKLNSEFIYVYPVKLTEPIEMLRFQRGIHGPCFISAQ